MDALSNALGQTGILVAQIGEAGYLDEPPMDLSKSTSFATLLRGLERAGFESIVEYEDFHGRFNSPWSYLLAMKDSDTRFNWFANEAEFAFAARQRIFEPLGGQNSLLRYFDGATMITFQFNFRNQEEKWCRQDPKPDSCKSGGHGFDPEIFNFPASSFDVKPSNVAPSAGRGVFARERIPEGAFIALEEFVSSMFVPSSAFALLQQGLKYGHDYWYDFFLGYLDGYGCLTRFYVSTECSYGRESTITKPY